MKKKKGLILGGILLLGIGFALVSTTLYLNGDINISANSEDFDVKFTKAVIDSEDRSSTAISADGKTINFTTKELKSLTDKSVLDFEITNNSSLYDAEVSIECTPGEAGDNYQITKEVASTITAKTKEVGKIEVQKSKLATETIEESFTCNLTAKAKERTTKVVINENIVNQTLECLKSKEAGSCVPGTEVQYKVNDSTTKAFHVLHDDGNTMTLQDRTATVSNTAWYSTGSGANNTKGPLTALEALESATSNWSNVNTITYTMGTTVFKSNSYTGCSLNGNNWNCTENTYTLGTRSRKARMITAQEAIELGCTNANNSCPTWMVTGNGYWTMSAISSSYYALRIHTGEGRFWNSYTTTESMIRAVIEISK